MDIARLVATRSTCLRRQVGATLVKNRHILTTGYNGPPRGIKHCADREDGCLRNQLGIPSGERQEISRAVHAEQNAVVQAAIHGISIEGSSLYCTVHPCVVCTKMLINAGVVEFIYLEGYPDELSAILLKEAEVRVRQYFE